MQLASGLYSGSPVPYTQPSLHAVGTGENAHVYGYGLYASNKYGVARSYADERKEEDNNKNLSINGQDYIWMQDMHDWSGIWDDGNVDFTPYIEAIVDKDIVTEIDTDFLNDVFWWPEKDLELSKEQWLYSIEEKYGEGAELNYARALAESVGFTSEAAIQEQTWWTHRAPGDESHLIEWTKRISKENATRILTQLQKELGEPGERDELSKMIRVLTRGILPTGEQLYNHLNLIFAHEYEDTHTFSKRTSEFLYRAGIDGVKYPVDATKGYTDYERGANYVAFSDEHLQVDHQWQWDGANYTKRFSVVSAYVSGQPLDAFDLAYLETEARGDREGAQNLVRAYAKNAALRRGEQFYEAYHGTQSFGFTVFDPEKSDDGRSLFFADSPVLASTYSDVEGVKEIGRGQIQHLQPLAQRYADGDYETEGDILYALANEVNLVPELEEEFDGSNIIVFKKGENTVLRFDLDYEENILQQINAIEETYVNHKQFIEASHDSYAELRSAIDEHNRVALPRDEIFFEFVPPSADGALGSELKVYLGGEYTGISFNGETEALSQETLEYIHTQLVSLLYRKTIAESMPKGNYHVGLFFKNPLIVTPQNGNNTWRNIESGNLILESGKNAGSTREWAKYAKDNGYDGVIFKQIRDFGGYSWHNDDKPHDVYIAFSSEQAKSLDPFTYDDAGVLIPLSQRFDDGRRDARFSVVSKEGYWRKMMYAQRRNQEDKDTVTTLTEEQHDALAELAGLRHKMHSSITRLLEHSDRSNDIANHFGEVINKLEELGLDTSALPYIDPTVTPESTDIYDEDIDGDYEEYYERIVSEGYRWWENINTQIEAFLGSIDDEHGTHYKPGGYTRYSIRSPFSRGNGYLYSADGTPIESVNAHEARANGLQTAYEISQQLNLPTELIEAFPYAEAHHVGDDYAYTSFYSQEALITDPLFTFAREVYATENKDAYNDTLHAIRVYTRPAKEAHDYERLSNLAAIDTEGAKAIDERIRALVKERQDTLNHDAEYQRLKRTSPWARDSVAYNNRREELVGDITRQIDTLKEERKRLVREAQKPEAQKQWVAQRLTRAQTKAQSLINIAAEKAGIPPITLAPHNPDAFAERRYSIGSKRKEQMRQGLRTKLTTASDDSIEATIVAIEEMGERIKQGGDPKTEKVAYHWALQGTIILPEDERKVLQAVKVATIAKVDPMRYKSPMELINAHADIKIKGERIDPDTVPQLTNKRTFHSGITIYDVEDTKAGQRAMRKIINTHFGEDSSPWCLLQGDRNGRLSKDAWTYWKHYNSIQKRVAFKDGKLLSFCASDTGRTTWWDREDSPHDGIAITKKMPNDELGRTATYEIDDTTGEVVRITNIHKGNRKEGLYEEWYDNGQLKERANYKGYKYDGIRETYEDGQLRTRETYKDGEPNGLFESWDERGWYTRETLKGSKKEGPVEHFDPNGTLRSRRNYKDNTLNGLSESWNEDGQLDERVNYKNGRYDGPFERWDRRDGSYVIDIYEDTFIRRKVYQNGKLIYEDPPPSKDTRFSIASTNPNTFSSTASLGIDFTKLPESLNTIATATKVSFLTRNGHKDTTHQAYIDAGEYDRAEAYARELAQSEDKETSEKGQYILAKYHDNDEAAQATIERILKLKKAGDLQKAKPVLELREKLDPNRHVVFVPVINTETNEAEGKGLNTLPKTFAVALRKAFNGVVDDNIRKVSGGHNTNASTEERAARTLEFAGNFKALPENAQIVLVDDTYTTGSTLAHLYAYIKSLHPEADIRAIATLAFSRYGKSFGLTEERLNRTLDYAKITSKTFKDITGYDPVYFTGAQHFRNYFKHGSSEEDLRANFVQRRHPVYQSGDIGEAVRGIRREVGRTLPLNPRFAVGSSRVNFNNARRNLALSGLYYGRSPQAAEIINRVAAEKALAIEARRLQKNGVTAEDVRKVYEDFGVYAGQSAQQIASGINKKLSGSKNTSKMSDRELLSEAFKVVYTDEDFVESYKRNQLEAAMRGYDAGFRSAQRLSSEALELQRVHKAEVDTLTGQNLRAQEARLGFSYLDTVITNPTDEMRLTPEERAARLEQRKQKKAREEEMLKELEDDGSLVAVMHGNKTSNLK